MSGEAVADIAKRLGFSEDKDELAKDKRNSARIFEAYLDLKNQRDELLDGFRESLAVLSYADDCGYIYGKIKELIERAEAARA
jgi:hypothetical protein